MAEAITITPANRMLALEATWELAALMEALVEHYGHPEDEDQRPLVVRGIAMRAHELNSTVMATLDNDLGDARDCKQRRQRVLGEAAAAAVEGGAA